MSIRGSEAERLRRQIEEMEAASRQLRIKIEEAEDRATVARLWEQLAHTYYAENLRLKSSLSWKITSPLRFLNTTLRRIKRKASNVRIQLRPSQAAPVAAVLPTPELNITFDVIGHTIGNYSLSEVNRAIYRSLSDHSRAAARLITVGQFNGVFSAQPSEQKIPQGTQRVAIVQHYPLFVPKEEYDLKALLIFWEEGLFPDEMVQAINAGYDAVLAPTKTVEKALIDSGVRLPVRVVQHPSKFDRFRKIAERKAAGSVDNFKLEVVFLHVSSCFPRKGVDILIDAYTKEFDSTDPVRLVIKGFPNPHNEVENILSERAQTPVRDAPITFINTDLSEDELLALYGQADVVVLPTRGEGLNLPAAEALAGGLRLIVTGHGGHMDFINEANASLIDYRFSQSESHLATNGSTWIEPNTADLRRKLREAFNEIRNRRKTGNGHEADKWATVSPWFDPSSFSSRLETIASQLLGHEAHSETRIAWISTFDVQCGIAEYSRHLVKALGEHTDKITIICDERSAPGKARNGEPVIPAWKLGDLGAAKGIIDQIAVSGANTVVFQWHPAFVPMAVVEKIFADPAVKNLRRVVTLHNVKHIAHSGGTYLQDASSILKSADRVLVHTIYDLNLLKAAGLTENVTLFPQGVELLEGIEPRAMRSKLEKPLIGSYGFFFPHKGTSLLIEAMPEILNVWPDAILRLVMAEYPDPVSAQEIERCRKIAKNLGIAASIEWHTEFQPQETSVRLLADCDIVVLPYQETTEASSAAARTALSSRRPVVVTPVRIFEDLGNAVHRLRGNDAASIADGVIDFLQNPASRMKVINASDTWLRDHSWSTLARRMHGMMVGLLNNERH